MELLFKIENQHIKRTDNNYIVSGSKGYLKAKFSFVTEEWLTDDIKTAIFKKGDTVVHVILNNDECVVPWEVIKCPSFQVSVFTGSGELITADSATVLVQKSGYVDGGPPSDPTPTVYDQIIDMVKRIEIGGVSDEQIEKAVQNYLSENPITGVDETEVIRIVTEYIESNRDTLKGDKGDPGEPGKNGIDGKDGSNGSDGKDGKDGIDGYSPTATVTETPDGAVITITDKTGTTSVTVKNGKDGKDGKDGEDGEAGSGSSYESKWKDKSLVAFGTSVTYLCGNDGGYLQIVKDTLGLSGFKNYGLSGHAIAYVEGKTGISRKIQSTDITSYDIITIEGCTNDFKLNIPLGNVGKIGDTNLDDSVDFCQALRKAIEYIFTENPTANILLIADTQRDNNGYDVNHINTAGYKLIDYVNAMIEIGALYGVPVCDLYRNSGFNALTFGTYTTDGLHPSEIGFIKIGEVISSVLNNMYSTTIIIGGGTDSGDSGDSGGNNDTPTPDNNIATINGIDYDISVASEYAYKMIMLLSDKYYLHYSNSPFYIYDKSANGEVFQLDTYRATNEGQTFPEPQLLSTNNYGTEITDGDGYKRSTRTRALSNYVWTNADILYWGTEDIAIVSSV